MKKIIKYNLIALLAMVFFVYSCDDDDYTGYSDLTATSPTITVSGIAGGGYTLNESAETIYSFDVTLSEAQISDIALYVTQIDGNASAGTDYSIVNSNSRVYIPANTTTGQLQIQVLTDELIEGTETLTLQIGDERTTNASITPVTVDFTIENFTNADFSIEMAWSTDVADAIGLDLDADEVIDLRMLILNAADSSIWQVFDGSSFESFHALTDTADDGSYLPDGDYLIAVDVYSTIDAGDYQDIVTVDATLDFYQPGVINNDILEFEAITTNETPCSSYRTYLANLTKSGTTYTFDDDAFGYAWSADPATLEGTWYGEDNYEYATQAVTSLSGSTLQIYGLGFGWMEDYWGETITTGNPVDIEFVWDETGKIVIPDQYYITTDWEGEPYDYNIVGTGVVNTCGDYAEMVITFDFVQDGWSVGGYMGEPWVETITLDPGAKSVKNGTGAKVTNKPVRR